MHPDNLRGLGVLRTHRASRAPSPAGRRVTCSYRDGQRLPQHHVTFRVFDHQIAQLA
ncbi:hypothetical protein PHYSODRAFT_289293 [Phytophthora sojae]|uniref:Uncharacterized protein n=1 Tax=Phytophthora sojae (strain P6497) TaxID=1094619 RepID=G5AHM0_PHYSP|nr:hypothetical protein PHYSODRAFT_289293 [Phytophthora sojae]EGZ04941.1 hypothetical protein PHYSODRAFT_289293 [Phytophthora sojae]|eukprot:XP_009539571.1 hypothetical protein PHYSODRAFT_289293 [Phytophthora sojae]